MGRLYVVDVTKRIYVVADDEDVAARSAERFARDDDGAPDIDVRRLTRGDLIPRGDASTMPGLAEPDEQAEHTVEWWRDHQEDR